MKSRYKADFDFASWNTGARCPPNRCEKGRCGFVIEGRMEIRYEGERVVYEPGDGVCIPNGPSHRHQARVLSDKAVVFFVEES